MKKIGKYGKQSATEHKKLLKLHSMDEIDAVERPCELQLPGCTNLLKTFAHRHSRVWYRGRMYLLSDWAQSVLACQSCHSKIDADTELREKMFRELRGEEIL